MARTRAAVIVAAATAATAATAVAGAALVAGERTHGDLGGVSGEGARSAAVIRLVVTSKRVDRLYPGARPPLVLTVHNRYRFAVRIRAIRVRVAAKTSRVSCIGSRQNIHVVRNHFRSFVVPARRSTQVGAPGRRTRKPMFVVAMPHSVVDACQGATFTLRYRAWGTRA